MPEYTYKESDMDDEQRNDAFGKTFVELADLTVSVISNSIISVEIPNEDQTQVIDDRDMILEWLKTITKSDYDAIKDCVEDLSDGGLKNTFSTTCQECNHNWEANVELDPVNFFAG